MTTTLEHPEISQGIANIDAFKVDQLNDEGQVTLMDVDGRKVAPTSRFWNSLCSRYSTFGLSPKLFKLFKHDEVFDRIKQQASNDRSRLRFTIEDDGSELQDGRLLAVTAPNKPVIEINAVAETIGRYGVGDMQYNNGVVRSTHRPPRVEGFNIGPDKFVNQYVMETPIDGYGNPCTYLSVLRMICTNGMVGYGRAFRSEIKVGNTSDADAMFTIARYLDSYNNEEGYAAIQKRFESASNSYASIAECNNIYRVLQRLFASKAFHDGESKLVDRLARQRTVGGDGASAVDSDMINMKIQLAYTSTTGDICSIYGLTHLDALTRKKMERLPAKCTVYDLFNLTSEVATHYTDQVYGRHLQAEIGRMISEDYDLENTKGDYPEFKDWFIETDGLSMAN